MAVSVKNSEASVDYFIDTLCPLADKVYQFVYAVTLNKFESWKIVNNLYSDVADKINEFDTNKEPLLELIGESWAHVKALDMQKVKSDKNKVSKHISKLKIPTRCAIALIDVLGLQVDRSCDIMDCSETTIREYLIDGRKDLLEVFS